jgi:hypothetical protein
MSDVGETSTAQAPFDNPDCDIILRSTDAVDFHVFKLILSLASPLFKDMFTLPQGLQSDMSSVPIIPVAETSTTLRSLLLLCYPTANPTFNNLEDAKAVMEAAKKYDMEGALSRGGDLVMAQSLPTKSLGLYVLCCRFGWQQHVQTVAARTLDIKDLGRPRSEYAGLQWITGLDYERLLVYHYKCGTAAQTLTKSLNWLEPSNIDMCMWKCLAEVPISHGTARQIYIAKQGNRHITPWFHEYLVSIGQELLARPCESTVLESESYDSAVRRAVTCSSCLPNAVVHMAKFRTLFAAEVKKVVAKVSLRN